MSVRLLTCPVCLHDAFQVAVGKSGDKLCVLVECLTEDCEGYRLGLTLKAMERSELRPILR